MPTLKELSYAQYKRFSANTAELIVFDQRVDIFEWVLHRVMTKDLYAHFERPHRSSGSYRVTAPLAARAATFTVGACAPQRRSGNLL